MTTLPERLQDVIAIDRLAQEIRRVDGSNSLGAAALAEALMPFVAALLAKSAAYEALVAEIAKAPSAYVGRVFDCDVGADRGEISDSLPVSLVGHVVRLLVVREDGDGR